MRLPFLKDKPDEVAGVMFAHVVGFVDNFSLHGIEEEHQLIFPEVYILGHWLQVVCIISAGGGATNRVMKILESYTEQVMPRSLQWFIKSKQLNEASLAPFQAYVSKHARQRREQYDAALRSDGGMLAVADIAVHRIVASPITHGAIAQASEALGSYLQSLVLDAVPRLKKMV